MHSELPAVSIVIPAKNEENRLPFCLKAIRDLDYNHDLIDIIVVDNGSDDTTCEIAKEYGCRVFREPSLNVSGMRNIGASQAMGSVLCFVDADVSVSRKWLRAAIVALRDDDVGCVTGELNIPQHSTWVERTWALDRRVARSNMEVKWSSSMNMIVKKNIFDNLGGFSDNLITGEDVEFCNRITGYGYKIIWRKEIGVVHFGEAKTLRQFVAKERWRGYSDLDLLLARNFKLDNLRHGTRPIFYICSFVLMLFAVFLGHVKMLWLSVIFLSLLPLIKSIIVSKKQKSLKYFPSLFFLWNLYFFARSIAIFDNIKDRLKGGFFRS